MQHDEFLEENRELSSFKHSNILAFLFGSIKAYNSFVTMEKEIRLEHLADKSDQQKANLLSFLK